MQKLCTLLLLFLILPLQLAAQSATSDKSLVADRALLTGVLLGRVVAADGSVLAHIKVSLETATMTATTDDEGRFSLHQVPAGKHILVLTGGGFVPQKIAVEIKAGQTVIQDARLEKIMASVDVVESLKDYYLEETAFATRTNTRLLDLPQSVQVFPPQLIEDRAILEGNELFRNVSGLNQNVYSAMTFRGFTQREILYNGARRQFSRPAARCDGHVGLDAVQKVAL